MLREEGVVIEVSGGTARISMQVGSDRRCSSCGLCKGASGMKELILEVPAVKGLKVGDRVTVEIPVPGVARSAAVIFLVPMVLFMAGLIAGELLRGRGLLPGGGGLSVLIAAGLMAAWYLGTAAYDRHLRHAPEHQPRIVDRSASRPSS